MADKDSGRVLAMARILAELEGPPKAAYEYSDEHPEATLAELERKLFELSRDCFAVVLAELIEDRRQAEEEGLVCPCGGRLRYKGEQARQQDTLVGLEVAAGVLLLPGLRSGAISSGRGAGGGGGAVERGGAGEGGAAGGDLAVSGGGAGVVGAGQGAA